jgi:hypothetical protein
MLNVRVRDILWQRWRADRRKFDRCRGRYVDLVPRVYRGHQYLGVVRGMRISSDNLKGGPKKAIFNFSSKSRRAMMMRLDALFDSFRPNYFVTLTYPKDFPMDGRVCKTHLDNFFSFLRGRGEYRGVDPTIKFFWKMEFQERGAVHYHILVESALGLDALRSAMVGKWRRLTGNGYEWGGVDAGCLQDDYRAKLYTALYTQKKHQNRVPVNFLNAGRFWGTMGIPKVSSKIPESQILSTKDGAPRVLPL